MKTIFTKYGLSLVVAQKMYNPDNFEDPLDMSEYDFEDYENEELNTYTQEDFENKLQDNIEEDLQEDQVKDEFLKDEEQAENYPSFGSTFQAMRWAKQNNEVVKISYTTLSGVGLIREVEPHGDFFARTTKNRIIATWDRNASDIRSFIVENISGYVFVGEKFNPKFNFSTTRKNYIRRLRRRKSRR